jgi:organic radical activating enzyme
MDKKDIKQLLDNVGSGFCLAKWTQTTVNLGIGETQSCHHNDFHVIPIAEIQRSPAALHNTEQKKAQRKLMLTGSRPKECEYCWKIEDHSNYFSDRVLMSSKFNAMNYYENIKLSNGNEDFSPTQLEVSFSNACNFACSYCSPMFSSKWVSDISKNGPYTDDYNQLNKIYILDKEENPYVDAFWKYLPTIYKTLHTLRITGGDPLMSRHTMKLLSYIKNNPNKDLTLIINTNLGVPDKLFYNFTEDLKVIRNYVKEVQVATSGESIGKKAEYIRDGLDYTEWYSRCEYLLSEVNVKLNFMCTYNVLCITSFTDFLKDIKKLYVKYSNIGLSVSSLTQPDFMSVSVAPLEWRPYLEESLAFISQVSSGEMADRFKHVIAHFDAPKNPELLKKLEKFLVEYDQRRGKSFKETFPEYLFVKV